MTEYDPFHGLTEAQRELAEEFFDLLAECQREGLIQPFCGMHDAVPQTDAEEHDLNEYGTDRCLPAFRLVLPEHRESVEEPVPDPEPEAPEPLEERTVFLTTWVNPN